MEIITADASFPLVFRRTESTPAASIKTDTKPDYRSLFENTPEMVLALSADEKLTILAASDAYLRAIRSYRIDIIGRSFFDIFPRAGGVEDNAGMEALRQSLKRVLEKKVPDTVATRKYLVNAGGRASNKLEERFWRVSNTPVIDRNGSVSNIFHKIDDVTESVKPSLKVGKLQIAVDSLMEGLPTRAADLTHNGLMRSVVTPALLIFFGLLTQNYLRNITGNIFLILYPALFFGAIFCGFWPSIVSTVVFTVFGWYFFIPPWNTFFYKHEVDIVSIAIFFVTGVLFSVFGGLLRTSIIKERAANIAVKSTNDKLRLLNQELAIRGSERAQFLEKIQRLDRQKSQFFANVSHELRTPLTLILGQVDKLLARPDIAAMPAQIQESLSVAARNARGLLKHVNDLLDIAKLETGNAELHYSKTDLSSIIRRVCSFFEPSIAGRNFVFNTDIPEQLPAEVDAQMVHQAVLNLLSNAFKFTPAHGTVRCSLSLRESTADDRIQPQYALLEVADNGPGVPVEIRENIFERFFQQEESSTRRFGGTGLGLAIAKEFIELHGGEIKVGDAPEGGALFSVKLPLKAAPGTLIMSSPSGKDDAQAAIIVPEPMRSIRGTSTPSSEETAKKPLVLVVEDNPEMNDFICEALSEEFCTVSAYDGQQGLDKALKLNPDLVISDEMMPVMSGSQMVKEIRSKTELPFFPIIMITAKADDESRVRMLHNGAQDYILKPFSTDEVLARIRNLVAIRKAQERLARSEQKFRGLLESSNDAFIIITTDGTIESINRRGQDWFGYEPGEVVGKSVGMLIPDRIAKLYDGFIRVYLANPVPLSLGDELGGRPELFGKKKDGTEFPIDITLTPLQTDKGLIISIAIRNITERRRIEIQQRFLSAASMALSETMDYQERLQRLANLTVPQLADSCIVYLLENEQFKVGAAAHVNPERSALLLETARLYPPKPNADGCIPVATRVDKAQLIVNITDEMKRSYAYNEDHYQRMIPLNSCMSVPLIAHGKKIGVLFLGMSDSGRRFSVDDVHFAEHVAARCALELDNARLYLDTQKAVRSREDIVAIVSHDLKNPLSVIQLATDLLQKYKPADVSQESWDPIKKRLDGISRATKQAFSLINDLLSLAKIQSGTFQLNSSPVDGGMLAKNVTELLHVIAEQKGIRLETSVNENDLGVHCDREKVSQVLSNLIGNALKFTPKGGVITTSVVPTAEGVHFSVRDTGQGINENDIQHIFDRYWQAKSASYRGTGLGLAIVKGIVEKHNGKLWVESEVGVGSTFHFLLPREQKKLPAEPLEHPVQCASSSGIKAGEKAPARRLKESSPTI